MTDEMLASRNEKQEQGKEPKTSSFERRNREYFRFLSQFRLLVIISNGR